MAQTIQIATEFTNAVLVAIMPYVAEFSKKLELPLELPITQNSLASYNVTGKDDDVGAYLVLTNGYKFWFSHGHIQAFESSRHFPPDNLLRISEYFGEVKVNRQEAIFLARSAIRQLGYSEANLYADLEPSVTLPQHVSKTQTIPRYTIEWYAPHIGSISARFEINGDSKTVESIFFLNYKLWQPFPEIPGRHQSERRSQIPGRELSLEEARRYGDVIAPKIDSYAKKLQLPLTFPILPEHIKTLSCTYRTPLSLEAIIDEGYSFYCTEAGVTGFNAPDLFFIFDREIDTKMFAGLQKMSDDQAIRLIKQTVKALGYAVNELHLNEHPRIRRPKVFGNTSFSRLWIEWEHTGKPGEVWSNVSAEIDTTKQVLKGLHIGVERPSNKLRR